MGVTKKPAVKAKTARKARISRTEAAFAQANGISLEELAKSKLPKRGRPVGSKNKPKALSSKGFPVSALPVGATITFEELNDGYVNWEKLAKQLQAALAAEMKENEALEKIVADFKAVIRLDTSFTFWDRLVFLFSGKL